MGSLLVDYPNAIEFVSEVLDELTAKSCLHVIARFLATRGVQSVHVEYGFSLKRDLKGQPQIASQIVPLAELGEVVETGLHAGLIEWGGNSDFIFSAVGTELRCMLCNDADLHLASVDRSLLQELASLISALGVTIYADGVPRGR